MKKFSEIQKVAAKRKGGSAALVALLPAVLDGEQLAQQGDDRYLSMMAKAINQAGFNWTVIDNKWPQFEEAFWGFNIEKLSRLSPEQWENYTQDTRVVRNWQKIKAVMENVFFVRQESQRHGSFGKFLQQWPQDDQVGLMDYMKKHGSRLGGQTAQWFLRYVGKDCFITTKDVVAAIQHAGVDITDNPTTKKDLARIQETMNRWHEQSGLPYAHISKIAAYSQGENYANDVLADNLKKFSPY